MDKTMNASKVLENINKAIEELGEANKNASWELNYKRFRRKGWTEKASTAFMISDVCDELSIFDWWNDTLSMSQLKQMKKFVETAIDLGFTGYVCFKVGVKGCSYGMWAHKNESTDGYSPEGDTLFHSFRSGDNYWDMELNGQWMHEKYADPERPYHCPDFSLKQIKAELAM